MTHPPPPTVPWRPPEPGALEVRSEERRPGSPPSPGTDPRALRPPVLATLLLASTLTVMAGAVVAPSLPLIREQFPGTRGLDLLVRLILTVPALFIVLSAPLAGWVADRRGRRGLLGWSVLLYALAGSAGAFLPSLETILVSRALLGAAVGGVMTAVTALLADYYDGEDRARAMGMQAGFMGLGGVLFTSLGGILAGLDWRGPFFVYLLALGVLPLVLTVLWEPLREAGPGGPGRPRAGRDGGDLPDSGNPEARDPPRAPLRLEVVLPVYGVAFLLQVSFYTIPVQLPFRLAEVAGAGPVAAGLAIGTTSLFFSAASLASARLNRGLLPGTVILRGFLLGALGFGGIALARGPAGIFPSLALVGLGFGLIMPVMSVWLTTEVAAHIRGRALGGLTTAVFMGQFVSPIVTQPVLRGWGSGAMYGVVALTLAGLSGILALTLRLRWRARGRRG